MILTTIKYCLLGMGFLWLTIAITSTCGAVEVSAQVEDRNQHLISEWNLECWDGVFCFRFWDSEFPAEEGYLQNARALDLLTGEWLEAIWLTPDIMYQQFRGGCILRTPEGVELCS